ncbi:MAG: iron-containing alcohol dehydrogenase [Chloroflexi bacterium]|nr:iron-containing alcohol dehydrogenase [Chloroflexota bacterium]
MSPENTVNTGDAGRTETAFTIDTSSIKFGPNVTAETGYELDRLGASRVIAVTDPGMSGGTAVATAVESLKRTNIDFVVFDQVSFEPTDASFKEAIEFAVNSKFDGFLPVLGLSYGLQAFLLLNQRFKPFPKHGMIIDDYDSSTHEGSDPFSISS